jgi:hypothetical protein
MALVDLVIVGLSIGFVVMSWISSRDGSPMISTSSSSSSVSEMKLPGLDDVPIMDKIAKKSAATASVAIPIFTEEETPAKEIPEFDEKPTKKIPEFDEVKKDKPKMANIECPMCSQVIEVEEKGILQDLVCDSCGFKGELEV